MGDTLGLDDRRVQGDLDRFKSFIERRGSATGAWRGTVKQDAVVGSGASGASDQSKGAR